MAITREQETDLIVAIRNGDKDPFAVSKGDITARVAYQMVQVQPSSVQMVPREHLDADVVKEAILRGGDNALNYLPADIVSPGIEYDEMSDIQRAAADGIEERSDYESLLERAINQDPRAISGIPVEYQKGLVDPVDLIQIAQNNPDTAWIGFVDENIFKRFEPDGDLRFTDTAYQVMAGNPNLMGEMFDSGVLSEDRQGDIKAAQHVLIEATNPAGSSTVRRSFDGEIEDIPAAVWTNEALINYAINYADVANVLMRYEEHTGERLNNAEKAEIASKDPEALGADIFKEIRESATASLMSDEDGLSQVKRFALEVDMGERQADVRPAFQGEDVMTPYAEAFLRDSDNIDISQEYIWDAGKKLDAERPELVEEVANGNIEAFRVHEKLKSGDLTVSDMSEKQMELMKDIKWESVEVSETFAGTPLDEARLQASPGDSSWMSAMERTATVEMESAGGLKLEFGIQSESRSEYQDVETLRDFYTCNVGIDGNAEASINGMPVNPSDMANLAEALEGQWSIPAHQEIGQIPAVCEAIADRKLTDLAIDNTLDVSRNETGDIAVSFSLRDPVGNDHAEFTTTYPVAFRGNSNEIESLSHDGSPSYRARAAAEAYVAGNIDLIANEVDSFKLQEVGLSNVEVDYELVEGIGQVYFVTFDNQGEPGYVGLDSETLNLDSETEGYEKLTAAQAEVLSEQVDKLTDGITPPMSLDVAQQRADELSELTSKDFEVSFDGQSYDLLEAEPTGCVVFVRGHYNSVSELNQALDEKILEARESITFERDEPKQEVERQRHDEEPERRGMRI